MKPCSLDAALGYTDGISGEVSRLDAWRVCRRVAMRFASRVPSPINVIGSVNKMMVHLLHDSVIEEEGLYRFRSISPNTFAEEISVAFTTGNLQHNLYREDVLEFLSDLCGVDLTKIDKSHVGFKDCDMFYVARIKISRLVVKRIRKLPLDASDFTFFRGQYSDLH